MLEQAGIVTVIRTILIIMLVYYGFRIVSKLLAPYLLKYVSKKAEQRFGQQFSQHQKKPPPQTKAGETSIDKMPNQSKSSNKNVGEYVDYEEID